MFFTWYNNLLFLTFKVKFFMVTQRDVKRGHTFTYIIKSGHIFTYILNFT